MFKNHLNYEEGQDVEEQQPLASTALNELPDEETRRRVSSLTLEKNRTEIETRLVGQLYRCLMLLAAMMVCIGHGSNDVANSISPLIVVFTAKGHELKPAYLIGSIGIALGLLALGYKVMETVGKKVVKLDFPKGFSAQFATAFAVILGTVLGMPLSTTHCMVGALLGLKLASFTQAYEEAYPTDTEEKTREGGSESSGTDPGVIVRIVSWWVATVPVALVASYVITSAIL